MNADEVDKTKLPTKPDLNSSKVCCTMHFELSNGKTTSPSFFVENSRDHPAYISIDFDSEGKLNVMVQKDIQDTVVQTVRQLIADNKMS